MVIFANFLCTENTTKTTIFPSVKTTSKSSNHEDYDKLWHCLNIWVVWWCIFDDEYAKIGHFGWSNLDFLQRRYNWSSKKRPLRYHIKTHTQKPNNQHEPPPPYPPVALSSPSIGRPAAPSTHCHGVASLMGLRKARTVRCGGEMAGSLVWNAIRSSIKKIRHRGALALGGRH